MSNVVQEANRASLRSLGRRVEWRRQTEYAEVPTQVSDGHTFPRRTMVGYVSVSLRRNPHRREADILVTEANDGETYGVEVESTVYDYEAGADDTTDDIAAGLADAITANSAVTAVASESTVLVRGESGDNYDISIVSGSVQFEWLDSTNPADVEVFTWTYPRADQGDESVESWRMSTKLEFEDDGVYSMFSRGNIAGTQALYVQVTGADADVAVDTGIGVRDFGE